MAIRIAVTIPGDVQTEGSAVYRLKQAIDRIMGESAPSSADEYKNVAENIMIDALREYVRRAEQRHARRQAIEALPGNIDVSIDSPQ